MTAPSTGRIALLDTFRFTAVTLALLQHVSLQYGLDRNLAGASLVWKLVARGATPSLLVIFGMMLEIAYARNFTASRNIVVQRMLYRVVLCYAAFVMSSFFASAAGKDNLISFFGSFMLLALVPYSNILATYIFLLVIGIGVIALRLKGGFAVLLGLVGLIWTVDRLYIDATSPWPFPFAQLGGGLLGWGNQLAPSALHGLTLVVAGMALAAAVFSREPSRGAWATVVAMLLAAAGILAEAIWNSGARQVAVGLADFGAYRASNDIIYYAYGLCTATAYLVLAAVLHLVAPSRLRPLITELGSQTLAYFVVGNAVLLMLPTFLVTNGVGSAIIIAVLLPTFWICTLLWLSWARSSRLLARAERSVRAGLETWTPRAVGAVRP